MPAFVEDFVSLADWDEGTISLETGHFVTAAAPSGLVGVTTAGLITEDNTGTYGGGFSMAKLDLVDGGVNATTYWISYAFYVSDWTELWMGGAGAGTYFLLPGLSFATPDADTAFGYGAFPILVPTSGSTGYFQGVFGPASADFADGTWHTMRMSYLNDTVTPLTTVSTYFDGALIDTTSYGSAIGTFGGGMFGVVVYDDQGSYTNANVYIAQVNYNPGADPGEAAVVIPPEPPPVLAGAHVFIDGADVSSCVQSGSVTRRLNRPASATFRMFTDCAPGNACSNVKIVLDNILFFHGKMTQISTEAGEDGNLMTEYTAFDPMWLWQWRPARAGPGSEDPGDFSNPDLFTAPTTNLADKGMGPVILQQILLQSEVTNPAEGEGPLLIELGSFATSDPDIDLSGAPTDYPMTIAEVFELMASTGTLDAVLAPIDNLPNMARLTVSNGDYGTDHSDGPDGDGTVIFEYATGNHNVRSLRITEDSTNICNKLWYYLGPRVESPTDPAGDQHWRANVTGSEDGIRENPLNHGQYAETQALIISRREASQESCGVRMEIRIYDAQGDENPAQFRDLYHRLWQEESWIRAIPRTLVHITPVRISDADLLPPGAIPIQLGQFDIGDLVTVTAGAVVRGGFTGVQRIYAYTISWDEDGIFEIGELQVSSDAEGI